MLDDIGDVVGAADDLLGGGEAGPRTRAENVPYYLGERLDGEDEDEGGSVRPNGDNTLDLDAPVEFIHFGRVHPDGSRNFPHDDLPDNKKANLDGEAAEGDDGPRSPISKGIMFRAGVEREAILLDAFIASAKTVTDEYESNKGVLGEVAGAIGDLVGGGGSEAPDPAELDALRDDVATAAGPANVASIVYPDIHKAGKDLRQCRCDYMAFADKLAQHYLEPGTGGGMFDMPGVASGVQAVQGIIFKAFDIYVAMFFRVREACEGGIARACHGMTIEAIKERTTRVFPVWFYRESDDDVPDAPAGEDDKNFLEEALEPVTDTIEDVKSEVEDTRDSVRDFLGISTEEPMAGQPFHQEAFAALAKAPEALPGACRLVIGVDSLPGFLETVIDEIAQANVGMLEVIYRKIMLDKGQAPIEQQFIRVACREYLAHKLVSVLADLTGLSLLDPDYEMVSVGGIGTVGGKQISDKAAEGVDAAVGKQIEPIIDLSAKQLHEHLEDARKAAVKAESMTMEVFLGRLPWLFTLMFRNTFFPVWELLVDKAFGSLDGVLGQAMSPIESMLGVAGDVVGTAKDVLDGVDAVTDKLGEGVTAGELMDDPMGAIGLGDDGGGGDDEPAPEFPGSTRITHGEGQDISQDELDEVDNNQAVETTDETDESEW